jgi:hypothetical protein
MAVTAHNPSLAETPKEDLAFGAGIASDHSLYGVTASRFTTASHEKVREATERWLRATEVIES